MPRSRCDLCGKRIGPARYELGLCPGCELVVDFYRAQVALAVLTRLLTSPEIAEQLEARSATLARRRHQPPQREPFWR